MHTSMPPGVSEQSHLLTLDGMGTPMPTIQTKSSPICDRQTAKKIARAIPPLIGLTLSTYFGVKEVYAHGKISHLALCALFNGASMADLLATLVPKKALTGINQVVSSWSYETILAASQIQLNLAPEKRMDLCAIPFIWVYGALQWKDVRCLIGLSQADFILPSHFPAENELTPTIGCTTRHLRAAKVMFIAMAVLAISLNVFYFLDKDRLENQLHGLGLPHDLIQDVLALFTGGIVGKYATRLANQYNEIQERQYMLGPELPLSLKVKRVIRNICLAFSPMTIGLLMPSIPHSPLPANYARLATVGSFYSFQEEVYLNKFENPHSLLQENPSQKALSCTQRIKTWAIGKIPSLGFFAALTGYFGYVATTSSSRAQIGIATLICSSFLSFMGTDLLAACYSSGRNRLANELAFRLIDFSIGLSVFFQYCSTKISIDDESMQKASFSLFIMALTTWCFWGLVVGNNRALNSRRQEGHSLPITPIIAIVVLSETFRRLLASQERL